MDHDQAVRQKATERYLLNELDPGLRDEFEEHLFDCQDCALDVRAAAMFVEQSKVVLAEPPVPAQVRVPFPVPAKVGWIGWLRPALAVPVFALLLVAVTYQQVVNRHLKQAINTPQLLPWTSINVSTRGSITPIITAKPGEGFLLFVNTPPDHAYSSYTADLYDPAGRLEWSLTIPAAFADDTWPIRVPGGRRGKGVYTLAVRGTSVTGQSSEIGRYPFELQIQQ
jgi:hypothetical protein